MKRLATIAVLTMLSACTDEKGAQRVLERAGYTKIHLTGYRARACDSKSDTYATGFTAKGPTGLSVSGTVCKGVWKGSTIRLDDE